MILDLDEEIVSTKNVLKPGRLFQRAAFIAIHQRLKYLASKASARDDETFVMLFEQFPIDLGLHVITLEKGAARELNEILVTNRTLRQCRQVVIRFAATFGFAAGIVHTPAPSRSLGSVVVGLVELRADNRLNPDFFRCFVEIENAIHVPVVSDADSGLTIGGSGSHHIAHARSAVEHRELGM
ncbi:unannotated protein [freshwater metagenome]|uniref:Unannotated protein n=1 Tax=freshwater metagenome TaxID=449393 RepID=A0A6J7L5Y2_9ZZZZ